MQMAIMPAALTKTKTKIDNLLETSFTKLFKAH